MLNRIARHILNSDLDWTQLTVRFSLYHLTAFNFLKWQPISLGSTRLACYSFLIYVRTKKRNNINVTWSQSSLTINDNGTSYQHWIQSYILICYINTGLHGHISIPYKLKILTILKLPLSTKKKQYSGTDSSDPD